ncbi:MAG TPA: Type 1 glutamine amidotransferase-like domain-containing protein [Acidimicrobiales bacterium]|nr:Type 1 glutamine amidotransferase-like domain-containing protein [Acidimicrobiales bacterium]
MNGWLAMVGGHEWTDGCRAIDELLLSETGAKEVLVVPTAAAYEQPQKVVAAASAYFADLGAKVKALDVLARPAATDKANVKAIKAAKLVYFADGSSLHLRSVLKDTPVWDAVVAVWNDGTAIAGTGAGAMVLGDPMVDPRGGAFTLGLGLVPSMAAMTKTHDWHHETKRRTIQLATKGVPLVAVDDATAVMRSPDGKWSVVGVGAATVYFNGDQSELSRLP